MYNKIIFICLFVILVNLNLVYSQCSDCNAKNVTCSINEECLNGYCNNKTCQPYLNCSSTDITNDDCPVDQNNFICINKYCVPTINQRSPSLCKTNSNCKSGVCQNNRCTAQDKCDNNDFLCNWDGYCNSINSSIAGTTNSQATIPPTVITTWFCDKRENKPACSIDNQCGVGYHCNQDTNMCEIAFTGQLNDDCYKSVDDTVQGLFGCDIGSGLICSNSKCIKYQNNQVKCSSDSNCLSPFEKCSCDGKCVPKYNLNQECKNAINKTYTCAIQNNIAVYSNSFYEVCPNESCSFTKACIAKDYDAISCHSNSFIICPSFDWSTPTNSSNGNSSNSSSDNSNIDSTGFSQNSDSNLEINSLNSSNSIFQFSGYLLLSLLILLSLN